MGSRSHGRSFDETDDETNKSNDLGADGSISDVSASKYKLAD